MTGMTSMMNTFGMWLWEMFPPAVMAAGDGDQVSVGAVSTIIGAIFTGIGLVAGKIWGKKEARETSLKPLPLPVELREKLATKQDLHEVEAQLDGRIGRVETALCEERRVTRLAESNVHKRIDRVAESLSELRGEIRQMNANLTRVVEKILNESKP